MRIKFCIRWLLFGLFTQPWTVLSAPALDLRFEHVFEQFLGTNRPLGPLHFITQDHKGLMWFAGNGVYRYDGSQVKHYLEHDEGQCSSLVHGLAVDQDGVVWAATDTALCSYSPQVDGFIPLQLPSPPNPDGLGRASAVGVSANNELYVGHPNGLVIINPARDQYKQYQTPYTDPDGSISNDFNFFYFETPDSIWIASYTTGLVLFTPSTGKFKHYLHDPKDPTSLTNNDVRSIAPDSKGRLWVGVFQGGLSRLDENREFFEHFNEHNRADLTSTHIWSIALDYQGQNWFSSDGEGLITYDEDSDRFIHFTHDSENPSSISVNKTITIFEDQQQNLWVSTYPSGIELINRKLNRVTRFRHTAADHQSLNDSGILSVLVDKQKRVWVGTEKGLNRYTPETQKFENYSEPNDQHWFIDPSPITKIRQADNGTLWLGTWGNGLYKIDPENNIVEHFQSAPNDPYTLNTPIVWDILPLQRQTLIGTQRSGLLVYDHTSKRFSPFHQNRNEFKVASDLVYAILRDSRGETWIATNGGLNRLSADGTRLTYLSSEKKHDNHLISSFHIRSLFEDHHHRIWIGTEDSGVFIYSPKSQKFQRISEEQGLPSNNVTNISQAPDNFIWLFTFDGIGKVNPDTFDVTSFNVSHGLINGNFNRGGSFIDAKGVVYAGSSAGLSVFNYLDLEEADYNFPVHITDLKIFNQSVAASISNSPLSTTMLETDKLTLKHTHTMLTFTFSALSYSLSRWNQYAYMLEGFDNKWNYIGNNNNATYTNIPPGKYRFKVKAQNSDGIWSDSIDGVDLKILPPPWQTWWAYCFYTLVGAAIIWVSIRIKSKQLEYHKEKSLNNELIRLNQIKDAFLANTSHELRTPLSGIIGLAEGLKNYNCTEKEKDKRLNLIISSSRRLSVLVNDILDYSKIAGHTLELHKSHINLFKLVDDTYSITSPLAADKNIKLLNQITSDVPMIYADENRLQQILINLVSNGIKYSQGGIVRVYSRPAGAYQIIAVEDTGIGIPADEINKIFRPFNQLETSHDYRVGGTGLGLSVTKMLVELHGGHIEVESVPQRGSLFKVFLPAQNASQPEPHIGSDNLSGITALHAQSPHSTILIADDDPVNRMVLGELLGQHGYVVIEANDGLSALSAFADHPDTKLVILDVSMPNLNGFDTCGKLRQTHSAEILPVLFLTANITSDDQTLCADLHAQGMLLKPTSKEQLLQKVYQCLAVHSS